MHPLILDALNNTSDYETCYYCTLAVGNLASAIKEEIVPFAKDYCLTLINHLSNPSVQNKLKPHFFTCLGDVFLFMGTEVGTYFQHVMKMSQDAMALVAPESSDPDMVDTRNAMREGVLAMWTSLIHTLADCGQSETMTQWLPMMVQNLQLIAADEYDSDEVVDASALLILDLSSRLGQAVARSVSRSGRAGGGGEGEDVRRRRAKLCLSHACACSPLAVTLSPPQFKESTITFDILSRYRSISPDNVVKADRIASVSRSQTPVDHATCPR